MKKISIIAIAILIIICWVLNAQAGMLKMNARKTEATETKSRISVSSIPKIKMLLGAGATIATKKKTNTDVSQNTQQCQYAGPILPRNRNAGASQNIGTNSLAGRISAAASRITDASKNRGSTLP